MIKKRKKKIKSKKNIKFSYYLRFLKICSKTLFFKFFGENEKKMTDSTKQLPSHKHTMELLDLPKDMLAMVAGKVDKVEHIKELIERLSPKEVQLIHSFTAAKRAKERDESVKNNSTELRKTFNAAERFNIHNLDILEQSVYVDFKERDIDRKRYKVTDVRRTRFSAKCPTTGVTYNIKAGPWITKIYVEERELETGLHH